MMKQNEGECECSYVMCVSCLPLLARVWNGHGDTPLSHDTTLTTRVLGILLQVPVSSVGPVTLVVTCTANTMLLIKCYKQSKERIEFGILLQPPVPSVGLFALMGTCTPRCFTMLQK